MNNAHESMASIEKRTCHAEKYSDEDKAYAKAFIENLPAVPSRYCRKKSTCLYLPQEFKNATNLYRIYLKHCQDHSKLYLSEKVFIKIFNEDYNIRFHTPKKDKCVICTKAENTAELLSEKEIKDMSVHLEEKKASYKRFKVHQKLTSNDTLTVSFDLQKVLNTPHGESMLLYYSRKYAVYNCTFYESQTKIGHCYVWGESDGKWGGNEIATCIYKFLLEIDKRPVKNVLLYCDSCPGQNKNKIVLTALHHFLQNAKNIEVVQINYLLPGHTYMPVDSMHAVIEREVRRIIVWSPSQWPTYMESARKRPEPYKINVLEYSDFIDWDSLVAEKFTNTSQKQIQLKAMRIVTFKKKNVKSMEVKYSMNENEDAQVVILYDEFKGRGSKGKGKGKKPKRQNQDLTCADTVQDTSVLPSLYDKPNCIPVAKYNDLKRLCMNGTIPKRFHKEYLDLPALGTVKDSLLETDEEDNNDID